jgi:hypothetical protein
MSKKSRRSLILDTVTDLVSNFLFYDRKDDEDLPRGSIEEAIEKGEISAAEIVERFRKCLSDGGVR